MNNLCFTRLTESQSTHSRPYLAHLTQPTNSHASHFFLVKPQNVRRQYVGRFTSRICIWSCGIVQYIRSPGSFSGRLSSPRPQRGPDPNRRISFAIWICREKRENNRRHRQRTFFHVVKDKKNGHGLRFIHQRLTAVLRCSDTTFGLRLVQEKLAGETTADHELRNSFDYIFAGCGSSNMFQGTSCRHPLTSGRLRQVRLILELVTRLNADAL